MSTGMWTFMAEINVVELFRAKSKMQRGGSPSFELLQLDMYVNLSSACPSHCIVKANAGTRVPQTLCNPFTYNVAPDYTWCEYMRQIYTELRCLSAFAYSVVNMLTIGHECTLIVSNAMSSELICKTLYESFTQIIQIQYLKVLKLNSHVLKPI